MEASPPPVDHERLLIDAIVESWRFLGTFDRAVSQVPPDQQPRFLSRSAYFRSRMVELLGEAGLSIAPLSAETPYDAGLPITALNIDEFTSTDLLVIDQVLEPTILNPLGQPVRMGTVMLRKVDE